MAGQYPKEIQECWVKVRKRVAILLESQKEGTLQMGGPVPEVAMDVMVPDI